MFCRHLIKNNQNLYIYIYTSSLTNPRRGVPKSNVLRRRHIMPSGCRALVSNSLISKYNIVITIKTIPTISDDLVYNIPILKITK